jgi:tRNA (mo5U34)-methyltransferase
LPKNAATKRLNNGRKAFSRHQAKPELTVIEMMQPRVAVVVSYFDARPATDLRRLMQSMQAYDPGVDFELILSVNCSGQPVEASFDEFNADQVVVQENLGMNIGAWDAGWRSSTADRFVFLQDDCLIKRSNWLKEFSERLNDPGIGLLGESYNTGWDRDWESMRKSQASVTIREHNLNGQPAPRVDVYLDWLARHRISPGVRAGHLRALVWAARRAVLQRIDGFTLGRDFGQCIGAEIAASKAVEQIGLRVEQIRSDPFHYIEHAEWRIDPTLHVWRHFSNHPTEQTTVPPETSQPDSQDAKLHTKYIENLSNDDLELLNKLLPWQCFTYDSRGRQFGQPAAKHKRATPQRIPDPRIVELNRRVPLKDRQVLEIGCFEGIHTIALAQTGAQVTAIDSRIENVVKTIVRTWSFGHLVRAYKVDVEDLADEALVEPCDVVHHCGVLYHLVDPVGHLKRLLPKTRQAIMLDTHFARDDMCNEAYEVDGQNYSFWSYKEGGRSNAFAGMYDHAKWLRLDDIKGLLSAEGFSSVDVSQIREERNGPRCLIYATR